MHTRPRTIATCIKIRLCLTDYAVYVGRFYVSTPSGVKPSHI